ncbi:MAG: hypothetical protein A3I04_01050 [Nitrospinae bacterium RIFCSPLOWO2_02_FULL_39_110]|nr:MAG: hypothetical protein A2W53_08425 [Nitrospinae bacterium RIFCSPHIGHO2_02_39_11]OGV98421.1 MAG: hypothetical protein A3D97_05705 [Nitrospinae bacterium RIFCSPHIGHO2_12_FULL_39_42]OGV99721.1 MAG: hypothetical protein A3D20_03045 [Nitrospinae bacterium RIFCSPHIGHO2_02_FULL_39_82]OGW05412.1 MAG: hypothetical protein A2Z59_03735 [Nitrospinae bacterium RIFCSPLOWO2_02_39_17]OGW07353.1 MAG: hypothetical protein A3I04_01050 [Nitrospinae bacterium RIFCSPLOWO2_02_FULL_39_110]OGW08116.1 MAG: hypoth
MKKIFCLLLSLAFLNVSLLDASEISSNHENLRNIIIDPAHGGADKGRVGKMGLLEKDVTLQVSLHFKKLASEELKMNIVMTREGDYDVPLEKRMFPSMEGDSSFFISIHTGPEYSEMLNGLGIYYLNSETIREELTENNESEDLEAEKLLRDMALSEYANKGERMAELIERNLIKIIPNHEIIVETLSESILSDINKPGVLIEIGNITDPEVEKKLNDRGYIDKICKAILNAIKEYDEKE